MLSPVVPAPNLAPFGALIGERARATMLAELLDGRALTATELAARAGVTPATASVHLARLVGGGLLAVEPQGRHRYFRLKSRRVARALESLAALATTPAAGRPRGVPNELRFARTCYDHLAGRLGVALENALVRQRLLAPEGPVYRVTRGGAAWLEAFGVDVAAARQSRRAFARACLDWSERRHHVAGALGRSLLDRLVERGWIERRTGERIVDLTASGKRALARELGVTLAAGDPDPEVRPRSLPSARPADRLIRVLGRKRARVRPAVERRGVRARIRADPAAQMIRDGQRVRHVRQ